MASYRKPFDNRLQILVQDGTDANTMRPIMPVSGPAGHDVYTFLMPYDTLKENITQRAIDYIKLRTGVDVTKNEIKNIVKTGEINDDEIIQKNLEYIFKESHRRQYDECFNWLFIDWYAIERSAEWIMSFYGKVYNTTKVDINSTKVTGDNWINIS